MLMFVLSSSHSKMLFMYKNKPTTHTHAYHFFKTIWLSVCMLYFQVKSVLVFFLFCFALFLEVQNSPIRANHCHHPSITTKPQLASSHVSHKRWKSGRKVLFFRPWVSLFTPHTRSNYVSSLWMETSEQFHSWKWEKKCKISWFQLDCTFWSHSDLLP